MAPKRKAAAAAPAKPRTSRQRTSKAAAASAPVGAATSARVKRGTHRKKLAASGPTAAKSKAPATKRPAVPKRGAVKSKASNAGAAATASSDPVAAPAPSQGGTRAVDDFCAQTGVEVVKDYDTTLNQTNLGTNANKFYRLQLLEQTTGRGVFLVWTRWGRVGVPGQSKMLGPFSSEEAAVDEFKAKFKAKTGAAWEDRANIEHKMCKYCPVDVDPDAAALAKVRSPTKAAVKYRPSVLDEATQDLISLIFDDSMFTSAMKEFEIDVEKFPLGQLSKTQVAKGHGVLQELKGALRRRASNAVLEQLTSKFYTVIPHAFGFKRPPTLNTLDAVNAKVDMCNVLDDIAIAQDMLGEREDAEPDAEEAPEQVHPADEKYALLDAELQLLGDDSEELPVIQKYIQATIGRTPAALANIWRVRRKGEAERFAPHAGLANRRLLWHGTNVAVVAAVLKTGLRIMPHSGGRVGKGIYLASEHSKSAAYVRCGKLKGKFVSVMFLAEAALGKEAGITSDDPSLVAAPQGCDSVVARGRQEPDPACDVTIELDHKRVTVPQGVPILQKKFEKSSFYQSEYLLYQESQVRLRYAITFNTTNR